MHSKSRRPHPNRASSRSTRPSRYAGLVNIATAILLLATLLMNFAPALPVAGQQEDGTPPPFPAPSQVVAAGSFQTALGCPADFDKTCTITALQQNADGTWTGFFPIPPGSYTYRVVASADIDRSFGEDGDPDGDDIQLDVPDGALGAFISFNQITGDIYGVPVLMQVELATDLGQFTMTPDEDGGYFTVVDAEPGITFSAQLLINGEAVGGTILVDSGDFGRALITFDGNSLNNNTIEPSTLSVFKSDADGNALTGSCFSAYDGDDVAGQACDVDDGEDGRTTIQFPLGAEGDLTLAESRTPEGQETVEPQDVEIEPGDNQVQVTVGGGDVPPDEEPTEEGVDEEPTEEDTPPIDTGEETVLVEFVLIDDGGNLVIGGCLVLDGVGEECDENEDGIIQFEDVPANQSYNLSESVAPDGFENFGNATIDVFDSDTQFQVPHVASAEEPEDDGIGNLILFTNDENGNPVPGVCYDVSGYDEAQCDEDGDGDMGLVEIPAGDYEVQQTSVPDGFELDEDAQTVTVEASEEATATFTSPSAQAQTYVVDVNVADGNGNPVPGACFSLVDINGNVIGEACDDDGDGDVRFDLEDGDYALLMTSTPEGFETAEDRPFSLQGEDIDVAINLTSTGEPDTRVSDAGAIDVAVTDPDGFSIIGACVSIEGPVSGEICDNGEGDSNLEDGLIRIEGLPDGDYSVTVTQLPEGFEPVEPVEVSITDGDSTEAFLVSGGAIEEEPTATAEPEIGSLIVRKFDEGGEALAGSCFSLADAEGNTVEICDNGDGDTDDRDGRLRFDDLEPGDYTLTETLAPDGYSAAEAQTVTIMAGETTRVNIDNELAQGALTVTTSDGSNLIGGACYELSGLGQLCDEDGDGTVQFDSVPPGDYTLIQTAVPDGYSLSDPVDQSLAITAGETTTAGFVVSVATASLAISVVDEEGNAVAGACFTVNNSGEICDNDANDADGNAGSFLLNGLPLGDLTITMSTTPAGYNDGGSAEVNLEAGETGSMTFTLSVAPGRLGILTLDPEGEPVAGACYSLNGGEPICDNGNGDGNDNIGAIRVTGLEAGDYTLVMTATPDGFQTAADQTFTITAGERTAIDVTLQPNLGSIQVTILDAESGATVAGACVTTDPTATPICDNGQVDADPTDGVILIQNIPAGTYDVAISQSPDGYGVVEVDDSQVTVEPGQTTAVERQVQLQLGSLTVTITDTDGAQVPGACVLYSGPGEPTEACDNGDSDADSADGVISLTGLVPGEYTVVISTAPEGYVIPEIAGTATVSGGETAAVDLPLELIPPTETATEEPTATETEVPTEEPTASEVATETEEPTAEPTEAATETEEATEVVIPPVEETPTVEPTPLPTGSIRFLVTDDEGAPLGGACFAIVGDAANATVCDNDSSDLDPADGAIEIGGLPVGEYLISQNDAPEGFSFAPDQTATIEEEGDTAEVAFVLDQTVVATGSLRITSTNGGDETIGGACYQYSTVEVCDNGEGDNSAEPGVIEILGVPTGEYTVTETVPPDGYQIAESQAVTIEADAVASLEFEHEPAEPETGGIVLELRDADGNPAEGACIVLNSREAGIEALTVCDNGTEDLDPTPGLLELAELPTGSYSATQAPLEDGEPIASNGGGEALALLPGAAPTDLTAAQQDTLPEFAFDQANFTVQANVTIQVVIIIIIELPEIGDLQITKRAADTNLLQGGACFRVTGEGNEIEVCDNDDVDLNGNIGILRLEELGSGSYLIEEITAPPGYQLAPDVNTAIPNGGTRSILIKDQPVADATGGLIVEKVDGEGELLPGACFQLRDEGVPVVTVCDDEDGDNDGRIEFVDIETGDYLLRETQPPSTDYSTAGDTVVDIFGGIDDQTVQVVNTLRPGRVRITKVAEDGTTLLGGSCFGLDRGTGIEYEACDNGTGDSNATTGRIQINNVPPSAWTVIETAPPDGYEPGPDEDITVEPGQTVAITVENQPIPAGADRGTVLVNKLVDGEMTAGACFSLRQGAVTRYAACDGNNDGQIEFPSVVVGDYVVRETKAPNPTSWYLIGEDQTIRVDANDTVEVNVENELKPGRILVIKKNTSGTLLQNACFRITPDPNGAGQRCTNAAGQVFFDNLSTTQTYRLTESRAPNGYEKARDVTGISLTPGLTTAITVIDKKTPPPPTDGSIYVIKFFCPTGKTGVATSYLDSSNPGPSQLAKTTGCTKGDARFILAPQGSDAGFEFNTGADGEYFTTLSRGTWSIQELAPYESDPEQVLIYAGQQTTVVVIDYVEPPQPKPATVNILKYTCDPGFAGVYYADFLANCTSDSQLTNNISFRTSGPTVARQITGASGQAGRTTFTGLKAGNYTLIEDDSSTSVSVYAFCGYDVYNWADWYSTTGSIFLPLGEGANVTCIWFNVPDDLSDSTGAVVVHKYSCNGTRFPAGYDYFANCTVETDGVKFAISVKQGDLYVPSKTGITNQNGLISFGRLRPGTYQLKEVGSDWCHAKSDSVDSQGNLIVRAGQRTNVWIFNCVPTKQPPNTGAGTMAGAIGGGAAVSSAGATVIGFVWPILGLVGFRARKRFRRAA